MKNKGTNWILGIIVVLVSVLLAYFFFPRSTQNTYEGYALKEVIFEKVSFTLWIADTPTKRSQGLSGITTLADDQGMLFVFSEASNYPFWMKDMLIPLDIIWLNEEKEVVFIKQDAVPEDYPSSYIPNTNALYVIEVQAGTTARLGIDIGDVFQWE